MDAYKVFEPLFKNGTLLQCLKRSVEMLFRKLTAENYGFPGAGECLWFAQQAA